jgi:diaminopimelate decarboxylase
VNSIGLDLTPAARAIAAARAADPRSHAFYCYDLDAIDRRGRRFVEACGGPRALCAYAVKANGLPAILETLRTAGLGAEAGSVGELELAAHAGVAPGRCVLNGNARTVEEAEWAASRGIHSVNADHLGELDLLDTAARSAGTRLRVALRVNPGIEIPGHKYVATGHDEAKFGVAPAEALEAWAARSRWPHLDLGGVHVHVGSQILDVEPLRRATEEALALASASAARGAPLAWLNLGGGFGVDYDGAREFPLDTHARWLRERMQGEDLDIVLEPGRWLVAPFGMLVAEVLWIKLRDRRRFVVLGAGMNDFLRPALYHARHRIAAVSPRAGAATPATLVGPVCESGDVFAADIPLPPLERGDWVALLDTGAYGAAMASNYNGRGRLAELIVRDGAVAIARAAETPADLIRR